MQDLKTLDRLELHAQTLTAAANEKQATLHLLECLHWVEERKVHLERGYPSLFAYVTEALGYSESQASERIRAMRLVFSVEEVRQSLEAGELTLTSAAKMASHMRREGLAPAQVVELLPQIAHKKGHELDRVLAGLAPESPRPERVRVLSSEFSELRVTLDKETLRLLEEARDLDANPGVTAAEILKRALTQYVEKKYTQKQCITKTGADHPGTAETAVGDTHSQEPRSRTIPRPLRREIWTRAQGKCEYTDPQTGRQCASTRALTYEHRLPFALGGSHTRENLALFCVAHNRYTAERWFKPSG